MLFIYIFVLLCENLKICSDYKFFSLGWIFKKILQDRKILHREHLIGCQSAKLFLPKDCFMFCQRLSCQNMSFWVYQNLTFWALWSWVEFCWYLGFVTKFLLKFFFGDKKKVFGETFFWSKHFFWWNKFLSEIFFGKKRLLLKKIIFF